MAWHRRKPSKCNISISVAWRKIGVNQRNEKVISGKAAKINAAIWASKIESEKRHRY